MKLSYRQTRRSDPKSQFAVELGVSHVYLADDPLWYLRLTSRLRLNWRRELATLATVFVLGIALGFLAGHS